MIARITRKVALASLAMGLVPMGSLTVLAEASASELKSASARTGLPELVTEVAFAKLKFDKPVALAYPNDGSHLLFVNEQHSAKVWSFPDNRETGDAQVFLELPDEINRDNEEGLLGLAFHPRYKENGQFFVYYSARDPDPHGRRSVVSRFRVSKNDPRKADPRSEERVWVSADDKYGNHNGGHIAFGPDGFLYITLGDGGAANDPDTTGQNPRDWFGSILRIDPDHPGDGRAYGIPQDNPASRDPGRFKGWAPEVFAIGLRNVWKFSFDRSNGDLWAGDVGQDTWEMVHRITNGGNYGWSLREANHAFRQSSRRQKADPASKFSKPIAEYKHDLGVSITGGYVYRGKRLPDLEGVYVYGDFGSGRIWGLRERDGQAVEGPKELAPTSRRPGLASFGEDSRGELYLLAFDGKIYWLVPPKR